MRLNKFLSIAGVASRRKADELISQGKIYVNGKVASELGTVVNEQKDEVVYDGKRVLLSNEFVYYKLNKPKGYICSNSDEKGRKTIFSLFPSNKRLFSIGRLDYNTEGLIIATNDGDFAHRVISPRSEIVKTYHAVTETPVNDADIEAFRQGIVLADGTKCLPAGLEKLPDGSCLVRVMEGKYHQVKRMLASRGKPVTALMRLSIGGLELDKGLLPGQFRQLSEKELCSVNKKK